MDRELKSRNGGVKVQMTTFSLFFGLQLDYRLYAISDNLSKTLQEKKMSAISGQRLARATLSTIEAMRNDESFDMFYEHVLKKAEGHNMVEEPKKEESDRNRHILFCSRLMATIKVKHITQKRQKISFNKFILKQFIIL